MESPTSSNSTAFPWVTCTISLAASAALWFPVLSSAFIYDRSLIITGEVWRCWTGHIVHFSANHFWWDMVIFVPVGCWLERIRPKRIRWFYVICPLAISTALLVVEPALERYAGISGVATGALVLLAGLQLRRRPAEPAWFWLTVLGLVAAKIGFELMGNDSLLVDLPGSVRVAPLAHIGGLLCGLIFQHPRVTPPLRPKP